MSLIVFLFLFGSITLPAQIPDFYKEYITVEIQDSSVEINGVYQLRNTESFPQKTDLFYPFPIDSMYGEISRVYAFETTGNNTVSKLLKTGRQGAMIALEIPAKSEKTLYIGYVQELLDGQAEYILTTTQKWGKPLESSQIELIVPLNLTIENISYQVIDTITSEGKVHYFIHEKNFMPDKNFVVRFSYR
jgi:hypothetical protein